MSKDIFQPTRAGTRGGQAQFTWDDVKLDKDRQNYLGHSLQVRRLATLRIDRLK